MSVRVDLEVLRTAVADQATQPFLVTVGDDGRPRVNSVAPVWRGERLAIAAGRHTQANAGARPGVTLLWPPSVAGGYSLLVDGDATVDADEVLVTPTSAILHRAAAGGGNDCVAVA